MPDGSLLGELNLRAADIVAGFFGGVVNAFIFRRSDPWSIIGSVVVGTVTAAYLTDWVVWNIMRMGFGNPGQGTAFIVGLCGMIICQGLVAGVKKVTTRGVPADGRDAGADPSVPKP